MGTHVAIAFQRDLKLSLVIKEHAVRHTIDRALQLAPDDASIYSTKSWLLKKLKRRAEAAAVAEQSLAICDQAIHLDPKNASHHCTKGYVLSILKREEEALSAFEHAILLNPRNLEGHARKIRALFSLKRYKKMFAAIKWVCYWFMH